MSAKNKKLLAVLGAAAVVVIVITPLRFHHLPRGVVGCY